MANPSENVPPTLPFPAAQPDEKPPDTVVSTPPAARPAEAPPTRQEPPATEQKQSGTEKPESEGTEILAPSQPPSASDQTHVLPGSVDDLGTVQFTPPTLASPPGTLSQTIIQSPSVADISAGQCGVALIPGYEILSELGRGGMGVVYKARQLGLNRLVALKMILSGAHAGRQELQRFQAEAEAVARLQHPNIVQIYEVGAAEGRPYFSLEFLEGGSLADKLRGEPLLPKQAARLVEMLARAMHAAHQAGIVHRDLKPANILLGRKPVSSDSESGATALGMPKITDFGLAKNLKEEDSKTQSGSVLGTPNYMAPEQAAGKTSEIGPPADTYALGAILYELLTGRPPFKGDGPWDTVKQVINEDPLPPARLRRGLPADLETICLKCLRKEPAKRYPSALALADDLKSWLAGKPITARPVSDWEKMLKWARRQPAVAALIGLLALVIVGGLIGMTTLWLRAEMLRSSAEKEKKEAEEARQLAQENEELARKAKESAQEAYARARQEAYGSGLNLSQIALQEARFDRANSLLGELAHKGDGEEDLRGFEWFYLWKLSHSGLTLRGHTNLVSCLVFSPDGKRMATSSLDGTVKVWDPMTGEPLLSLEGHKKPVRALAYSPDGKRIATGSEDGAARLWNASTGKEQRVLKGHTGFVTALAFSADGSKLATASEDRTALVWDIGGGEPTASAGGSPKKKPLFELRGHRYGLTSVAFRPDGKQLVTGSWDKSVRLWDADGGSPEGMLPGHEHWVRSVAYSPDSTKLATASWDRKIRIWDADTRELLRTLKGQDAPVQYLCFAPDGNRLLTLSIDQTARLWDLTTREDQPQRVGNGPVRGIAFSPDGQLLASVRFDFTGRGQQVDATLSGHASSVHALAFRPGTGEERLASGGADGIVKVWNAKTEEPLETLTGHEGPIRALAYSPDGSSLASGSEDGTVRLWSAQTGRNLRELRGHGGWVMCLAFSPDGKYLASGSEDRSVRVWDVTSRGADAPVLIQEGSEGIHAVAYSRDGKHIVSGSAEGVLHFFDARTGEEVRRITAHQGQVGGLTFSPDGKLLASGGWDGVIVLRQADTGKAVRELKGHAYGVTGLAFSPDGKRLASSSEDRTAKLWDVASGRDLLTLTGHAAGATDIAFNRDGTVLASSCWDQKVRLWRAPRW